MSNTDIVEAYEVLRAAVAPLDAKLRTWEHCYDLLYKDQISPVHTQLLALRKAVRACRPVGLVATFDLNRVRCQLDECFLLIAAHLSSYDAVSVELRIREQRKVIEEFLKLSKAVHKAVRNG